MASIASLDAIAHAAYHWGRRGHARCACAIIGRVDAT
jgi:hypothetical protein